MRRFEFKEGTSSKFWEINLDGGSFTVAWGKIGTAGSTQTKSFPSGAAAQKEHDKLVAEKLKKGYVETGAALAAKAAAPAAKPAASTAKAAAPTAKTAAPAAKAATPAPPMTAPGVTVVLNPELKRRGSRNGPLGQWKKQTPASLAKTIQAKLTNIYFLDEFKTGLSKAQGPYAKAQATACKALAARALPETKDPFEMAAVFRLAESVAWESLDAMVRYWLETLGPAFALQVLAETFRMKVVDLDGQHKRFLEAVPARVPLAKSKDLYWSGRWLPVRDFLLACDDATYASAREVAAELRTPGEATLLRAALTELFPDETDWVKEDLRAWTKAMSVKANEDAYFYGGVPGRMLAGVTPKLLPDAFAFVKAITPRGSVDSAMIGELLARCGAAADEIVTWIATLIADYSKPDKTLVKELAQLQSVEAARFFVGKLSQKQWRPFCMEYLDGHRDLAIPALEKEIAEETEEDMKDAKELLKYMKKR